MAEALAGHFQRGFGRPARPHQVDAPRAILAGLAGGERRLLVQAAPGSGKTEAIGLLAFQALRSRSFDHVVVLNYAVDLEEQAVTRLQGFWQNLSAVYPVTFGRTASCSDVQRALVRNRVQFSLLQKFVAPEAADSDGEPSEPLAAPAAAAAGENSGRILVIIDEAHRGIPEEGAHIRAVEARYGAGHSQVLFTATPKRDTLLSHGRRLPDGRHVAVHCHTQREAVNARHTLNPLEFYKNCVPGLQVNGTTLAAMKEPVSIDTFVAQLNHERCSRLVMEQRAKFVMDKMPDVYDSSPLMTQRGHQIKVMVVLPTIQAVYDFGCLLRQSARGRRTALGRPFVIGTFFSLRAQKRTGGKTDMISEHEANGGATIDACDIIVTCKKYVTGYDEWRVCAVFLATRISQPEFLQQVLGRATRARPGEGKRRPLIFDLANNPDVIFASVLRFWDETSHFPEPLGELKVLHTYIQSFGMRDDDAQTSLTRARRFPVSDQMLLRAAVVSYWRAAAGVSASNSPLRFEWLLVVLEGLNLHLCDELFGGSAALAKLAARDAASGQEPRGGSAAATATMRVAKTVPAALKVLRSTLELGRRKRPRKDAEATSARKRRQPGAAPADEPTTPQSLGASAAADPAAAPSEVAATSGAPSCGDALATPTKQPAPAASTEGSAVREALEEAIAEMAERFAKDLPAAGDEGTPDRREALLERFDFAAAPLKKLQPACVAAARRKLSSRLSNAFGKCLRDFWTRQKVAAEDAFAARLPHFESRAEAVRELDVICMEFRQVLLTVGGRSAGAMRSGMTRGLLRRVAARFPEVSTAG